MGGMQVLQAAASYPDRVFSALPVATAARHTAQNIAFHEVGRQAIMADPDWRNGRSEEHTSELQSLMRISYAVFCLKTKSQCVITIRDGATTTSHLQRNQHCIERPNS